MRTVFILIISLGFSTLNFAQSLSDYTIKIEPVELSGLAGIQSYSWAKSGDEVLIIGGRLDGLHRRQPFASFDSAGHNNQLIVLNLKTLQVWKRPVSDFKEPIASQLKATNHCYHQQGDTMVLIGGYGIDETTKAHVTFNKISVFSVQRMLAFVKGESKEAPSIWSSERDEFSITGGQLNCVDGMYYLVGGHNFQGRYNPRNMPTFTQKYNDGLFRFKLNVREKAIFMDEPVSDSLLHKRDYNMIKVQHVKDTNYLVAMSGVFQYDADLPFQNLVQITPTLKVREYPDFRQFYNHYECADFSVFDAQSKTTTAFLLGGISNFYDSTGILVQNNDVPFVRTISKILFAPDGTAYEYLLPNNLPQLLGAGASFIPNDDARWSDGFFNWNYTDEEEIEVGYMLGGIVSQQPSTFWYSEGELTNASNGLYKVILQKTDQLPKLNSYSKHPLNVKMELNHKNRFDISFTIPVLKKEDKKATTKLTYIIKSSEGKLVKTKTLELASGSYNLKKLIPKSSGIYYIELNIENRPLWTWKQYLYVE